MVKPNPLDGHCREAQVYIILPSSQAGKKCWRLIESSCPSTSKLVVGLSAGTNYEFRVFAVNAVGMSPPFLSDRTIATNAKMHDDGGGMYEHRWHVPTLSLQQNHRHKRQDA